MINHLRDLEKNGVLIFFDEMHKKFCEANNFCRKKLVPF
jgi:hypothetical protein